MTSLNDTMDLAGLIDYTILDTDCSLESFTKCCDDALQNEFSSVCVLPYYAKKAVEKLANSPVKISTVIGFPLGFATTAAKVEEIKRAINDGVDEIDVLPNITAIKNQDWTYVKNDLDTMTRSAHLKGKTIKINFELALLNENEVKMLCEICNELDVDFVKTDTGFHKQTIKPDVIALLKSLLNDKIKIIASGGIRSKGTALKLITAGANRISTSRVFVLPKTK